MPNYQPKDWRAELQEWVKEHPKTELPEVTRTRSRASGLRTT